MDAKAAKIKDEWRYVHGFTTRADRDSRSPKYRTYAAGNHMVHRCCDPQNQAYKWYGARGITGTETVIPYLYGGPK